MSNTLIGLGDVLNDLINLHNSNRLPNKLLLSGTQGIGKGVLSKHLVNYILSKNEPFEYDPVSYTHLTLPTTPYV